jgi:hypothetical protein
VGVGGIFYTRFGVRRSPPARELLGTAGAFFGTKTTPEAFWDHGCDRVLDPDPK